MCRIAILKHITLTVLLSVMCFYDLKSQHDSIRFNSVAVPFNLGIGGSALELNSNYYLMGGSSYLPINFEFLLVKFDNSGNQLKFNKFSINPQYDNYWKAQSLAINDKIYYIGTLVDTGNNISAAGVLICFNKELDTLYTKILDTSPEFDEIWVMKKHPTKNQLYFSGQTRTPGNTEMYLLVTDTLGNTLHFNTFGSAFYDRCRNIDFCANGDILFAGFSNNAQGNSDMYVVRTDSAGNVIWEKKWGVSQNEKLLGVTELESGNIICSGAKALPGNIQSQKILAKLSAEGDLISEYQIDTASKYSGLGYIIKADAASFYTWGSFAISNSKYWPIFYKLDTLGNIIYSRVIESDGDSNQYKGINDFKRTSDSGFVLAGTKYSTSTEYQSAWLVKLDSLGCLVAGCDTITGIKEITLTHGENLLLQSWPNPTSGQFFCSWPQEQNQPTGYRLTNLTGQLVAENPIPFGQNHLELNLGNEPSGVYFLSLFDANRVLITKRL